MYTRKGTDRQKIFMYLFDTLTTLCTSYDILHTLFKDISYSFEIQASERLHVIKERQA